MQTTGSSSPIIQINGSSNSTINYNSGNTTINNSGTTTIYQTIVNGPETTPLPPEWESMTNHAVRAVQFLTLGNYAPAWEEASVAIQKLEELKAKNVPIDDKMAAGIYGTGAIILCFLDRDYQRAYDLGQKAFSYSQNDMVRVAVAITSHNLANYFGSQGRFEEGLKLNESAIRYYESNPTLFESATQSNSLAVWYSTSAQLAYSLGRYTDSEKFAYQANSLDRSGKYFKILGSSLTKMGYPPAVMAYKSNDIIITIYTTNLHTIEWNQENQRPVIQWATW